MSFSFLTTPLFAAKFAAPGWVQFFYSFQFTIATSMGMTAFFYPNTPAIAKGGYWQYLGEDSPKKTDGNKGGHVVLAPNVRAWGLRNAFAGVVNGLAFYYGSRETYVIMAAVAIWRETWDIVEAFIEKDTDKVFYPLKVPAGKFPPLGYFPPFLFLWVVDVLTLYTIVNASD